MSFDAAEQSANFLPSRSKDLEMELIRRMPCDMAPVLSVSVDNHHFLKSSTSQHYAAVDRQLVFFLLREVSMLCNYRVHLLWSLFLFLLILSLSTYLCFWTPCFKTQWLRGQLAQHVRKNC